MDSNANYSSKSWCSQCRRYIADPSEVGSKSDGVCPHYGWALLKSDERDMGDGGQVFPEPESSNEPEGVSPAKKGKSFLGEGRGIVAQSAVKFSHESEEVLKNDPVVHRNNDAGMLGTLAGVMLGLFAVLAFFMFSPGVNTANDSGLSSAVADSGTVTGSEANSKENVIKFIDKVSQVDDVDKLLEVIRFPELLEPLVRMQHEAHGTDLSALNEMTVVNYSEASFFSSRFGGLVMRSADRVNQVFVLVEISDDGKILLDWETLVGAAQRYWSEFEVTQPSVGVPLWVSMHRTTIVDVALPEGEDPEQWMALKVMSPAIGLRSKVYLTLVKKGDAFGDYVEANIPWNTEAPNGWVMAVTARFAGGLSPMIIIDELRAPGSFRSPGDVSVFPLKKWE